LETDPTRMCELLVGLPEVAVLGVAETDTGLRVRVETIVGERPRCGGCGVVARSKDRDPVVLVDLPSMGRPVRLVWLKRRWCCPNGTCPAKTFTEIADRIASARQVMTRRAGMWATVQVGRRGRTVSDVAAELGCDWHTVNDTVMAWGTALLEADTERIGTCTAIGLDETKFIRRGRFRRTEWATTIADVGAGRLLDVVPGRSTSAPIGWLRAQGQAWLAGIAWGTLDMSGTYRAVYDTVLPNTALVADPFHVVKLANERLDEVRRRVQNTTLGHRGRKHDPLYRIRRLLTMANERHTESSRTKLDSLVLLGDPDGEVRDAWIAKEAVRDIYLHHDPDTAHAWVQALAADLASDLWPPEIRRLGRTLRRWAVPIANWHRCYLTNAATEAANNLIKRVKRVAFGFRNFANYRTRILLYAGRPNWHLLPDLIPAEIR
jgi:transposase